MSYAAVNITKTHEPGGAWLLEWRVDDAESGAEAYTSLTWARRAYQRDFTPEGGWPLRLTRHSDTHYTAHRKEKTR